MVREKQGWGGGGGVGEFALWIRQTKFKGFWFPSSC